MGNDVGAPYPAPHPDGYKPAKYSPFPTADRNCNAGRACPRRNRGGKHVLTVCSFLFSFECTEMRLFVELRQIAGLDHVPGMLEDHRYVAASFGFPCLVTEFARLQAQSHG